MVFGESGFPLLLMQPLSSLVQKTNESSAIDGIVLYQQKVLRVTK